MNSKKYLFTGKTFDNALDVAKKGLNSKFVEFEVLVEGSKGFLGIGAKDCKIAAWIKPGEDPILIDSSKPAGPVSKDIKEYKLIPDEPIKEKVEKKIEKKIEKKKPEPKVEAKKVETKKVETKKAEPKKFMSKNEDTEQSGNGIVTKSVEDAFGKNLGNPSGRNYPTEPQEPMAPVDLGYLKSFVSEFVDKMGVKCGVDVIETDRNIKVVLDGEDIGVIIGRRGETLNSLQYIVNLHINKGRRGDNYKRITIDSLDYRKKREESLRRLAKGVAGKVIRTGEAVELEPMESYERRVIHAQLQENTKVATKSVGDDPKRHIVVYLK